MDILLARPLMTSKGYSLLVTIASIHNSHCSLLKLWLTLFHESGVFDMHYGASDNSYCSLSIDIRDV